MDPTLQSHQLHQLGQPQQTSHAHPHPQSQLLSQFQQQPHLQQHLQQLQQQQQQQQLHQQQQQQLDSATPQDVLVEARKNLQVLIDSGLSKDLLHQWVDDDSFSLQLSFPGQQPLAQSSTPPASASTPIPSPLSHPVSLSPSHHMQSPQASALAPPLHAAPPPQQIAPASASSAVHSSPVASLSASSAANSPTPVSSAGTAPSPGTGAPPSIAIIKTEPSSFADDVSRAWAAAAVLPQAPGSMPGAPPQVQVSRVAPAGGVVKSDPSAFISPSMPYPNHRPRISVSSTSSGSSGHASIWSVNSARSSMSWASASSSRTQPSLPMTPSGASSSSAGKTNIYWCTSCETSFKRKYDWKRHEDEFHERWRKYPCPEPGCNRSFWGSNSFNQHHKQCHGCKTCPHAEKVVRFLRKRKYWACGFCSALHPARERHVEHVARHFESGLGKADWMHSRVIYGLLHQPLIHGAWDALVTGKQAEFGGRRPQFSWHPSKTGRAQGFLEKENPGQLQDLLEFFSGDEGEAQWIVSVAFDLSDMAFASAQPPAPTPSPQPQFAPNAMAPPAAYPQQQQDTRMSFATPLPSQAPQQMLASPAPFASSTPYRTSAFVPSQAFPPSMQQSSPDLSTQSPMAGSQPHIDKRELPPVPMADGMMDFEYSPAAPVIFEDWESIASSTFLDTSAHQQQQQQQPLQVNQPGDWGIAQFYGNPNVN
ncbi:homeobox and c2h2 transcription factor [Trichoderma arundinaceum]|uniref:Homeobox and c2h2 transcription factor n=1 Tax=Trichoderma arundinaceum TaxID=490622 RepID=A0A395NK64_TRIAR|nr:homeobox and c2h2 transcription factor [Trichoderma arundinaceum]